jgi:hypothetical protein
VDVAQGRGTVAAIVPNYPKALRSLIYETAPKYYPGFTQETRLLQDRNRAHQQEPDGSD